MPSESVNRVAIPTPALDNQPNAGRRERKSSWEVGQPWGTGRMRRAHLDQGVRGAEAESALATANVSLRGGLRESAMLDPSGLTPGRLFGERSARSYAAGPGFGGREPSRFLGTKQLEKPETDSIIVRTTERMEDFHGVPAQSVLFSSTKP